MSESHRTRSAARALLKPTVLAALLAGAFAAPSAFGFNSGSTGADGALNPTVSTQIQLPPSGILNYTSINIPAGVTVTFTKNVLNTPVYLLVVGGVTIAGTIDVSGANARHVGTAGDGNLADDGIPGTGGPGGYDGGRGGRSDAAQRSEIVRGGAGLGPGGGLGGLEDIGRCSQGRYGGSALGAAHATNGSNPNFLYCGAISNPAAKPYGSNTLQPLIGGSGGGGAAGGTNYGGAGGGGGGGAVLIAATGTISIPSGGMVRAAGGDGGGASGVGSGAPGAGGSGGAIRLLASTIAGAGALDARGGCSYSGNTQAYCGTSINFDSIGGSDGRIRLEGDAITFSGSNTPVYSADVAGPIFLANGPSLRIASVAGAAVPAMPTGNADVTLPANIPNPVSVAFETANVPIGNTVLLKVIPASGFPTEAISPAIAGTTAAGTTSVQVNLPQGPSVLQATTTYTVVVAMGEALSRFAQNERVEKVQLIATVGGGEGQVRLITVTGKEYLVPMSVLQMVGFTG